jgi:uncharacterized membrane protein
MSTIAPILSKRLTTIAVLATTALPLTAYLTYAHFKEEASSFCNFGESFNCDIVNQSEYSELFGIPVSILGFLTYLLIVVLACYTRSTLKPGKRGKYSPATLVKALAVITGGGTAFSLYLTYVEAFILMTWCVLCVAQQILVFIMFMISISLVHKLSAGKEDRTTCEFC